METPSGGRRSRRHVSHKRVQALGFARRPLIAPKTYTPVRRSGASPRTTREPSSEPQRARSPEPLILPPLVAEKPVREQKLSRGTATKYKHVTPRIDTKGARKPRKRKGQAEEEEAIRSQVPEGMKDRPIRELKAYLKAVSSKVAKGPATEDPATVALSDTQRVGTPSKSRRRHVNRISSVAKKGGARKSVDGEDGGGEDGTALPPLSAGAGNAYSKRPPAKEGWEEARQAGDANRRSQENVLGPYLEGWKKCELTRLGAVERAVHQICQDKSTHGIQGALGEYVPVWFSDRYGVKTVVEKQLKRFLANVFHYAKESATVCAFAHMIGLSNTYPDDIQEFYAQLVDAHLRLRLRMMSFGNQQYLPLVSAKDLVMKFFGARQDRAIKLTERLENSATAFRETLDGLLPLNRRESKVMVVLANTARILSEESRDLRDLFDNMDDPIPDERTHAVDSDGLLGGFSSIGVSLTERDAQTLLRVFRAKDGYVSWGDFKRGMTSRLHRIGVPASTFMSLMLTEWVECDVLLDNEISDLFDSHLREGESELSLNDLGDLVSELGVWVNKKQLTRALPDGKGSLSRTDAFRVFRELGLVRMTRSTSHEQSMARVRGKARGLGSKSRAGSRPKTSHGQGRQQRAHTPSQSTPAKSNSRPKTAAPTTPRSSEKEKKTEEAVKPEEPEEELLYHGPMLPPSPMPPKTPTPPPVQPSASALAELAAAQEAMLAELAKIDAKQEYIGFALSIDIMDGDHQRLSDCRVWSTVADIAPKLPLELAPPRPVAQEEMQVYVEPLSGEPQFVEVQEPPGSQAPIETKPNFTHIFVQAFAVIGHGQTLVPLGSLSRTRQQLVTLSKLQDVDEWGTGCQVTLECDSANSDDTLAGDVNLFYYPGYRPSEDTEVDIFRDLHFVIEWPVLREHVPVKRYEKANGTVAVVHKFGTSGGNSGDAAVVGATDVTDDKAEP